MMLQVIIPFIDMLDSFMELIEKSAGPVYLELSSEKYIILDNSQDTLYQLNRLLEKYQPLQLTLTNTKDYYSFLYYSMYGCII